MTCLSQKHILERSSHTILIKGEFSFCTLKESLCSCMFETIDGNNLELFGRIIRFHLQVFQKLYTVVGLKIRAHCSLVRVLHIC